MNGHYRPPAPKSASKATPSTLCQKCLKRGHYSYECKSGAQERPYVARPSRTQVLFNPKLAPKLSSDVPNDLLRKKGVADEQLAELAADRGRKRTSSLDRDNGPTERKRSRSAMSDASSSSVSTISTNRSPTPSPCRGRLQRDEESYITSQQVSAAESFERNSNGKRRRSPSYGCSSESDEKDERNTRRRRNARSPDERGRGRERGKSAESRRGRKREYTASHSSSRSRGDRRNASRSPARPSENRRNRDQPRSRSRSPYRRGNFLDGGRDRKRRDDRGPGWRREGSPQRAPPPVRERSLSPYSKRIALTQAIGRSA